MGRIGLGWWVLLLACAESEGLGDAGDGGDGGAPPSELLSGQDPASAPYRAVGRLQGGAGSSECTAFVIDVGGGPDAPAYALTNGHCTHPWGDPGSANAVHRDTPAGEELVLLLDWFADTAEDPVEVRARAVPYATMKGRDLAIVELDATVGSLSAQGIAGLRLAASAPTAGARVEVVGAPLLEVPYLRRARCAEEGAFHVAELGWHWWDARRNRCADIAAGSSGSPVLDADGRAYAVLNTTTRGSPPDGDCHLGRPCELASSTSVADASYASEVTSLAACFDGGRFAPSRSGCALEAGAGVELSTYPPARTRPTDPATGEAKVWGVTLAARGGLDRVRLKQGPAATTDCRTDEGFSDPIAIDDQPLEARPLPETEGVHLVCVRSGAGDAFAEEAQVILTTLDTTAPARRPLVSVEPDGDGLRVEPIFSLPEHADFWYAVLPADASCDDPGVEWSRYRRNSITVGPRELPATYCLRAVDAAGNEGPAHAYPLVLAR